MYTLDGMESSEKEKKISREIFCMAELRTIYSGLNDRDNLRLELRRNFKERLFCQVLKHANYYTQYH